MIIYIVQGQRKKKKERNREQGSSSFLWQIRAQNTEPEMCDYVDMPAIAS